MIEIFDLRCEHLVNPIGIGTQKPRFSWKLKSDGSNIMQKAYRIQVAKDEAFDQPVWDSGVVQSAQSVLIPYEGEALKSSTRYYYRVRMSDASHKHSNWSDIASFTTALLDESWQACMISGETSANAKDSAGTMLRREFSLRGDVACAIAYATAHGVYELHLNGQRVGDWAMTPGWTEYDKRLLYQSYDVTALLHKGENAVGAMLGNGWYKGNLVGVNSINHFGDHTAFTMQLLVTYTDGSSEWITSDKDWTFAPAPVTYSEIYHGETYDARLAQPGWNLPGFDASAWQSVHVEDFHSSVLKAQDGLPVRRQEVLKPVEIIKTPAGETVFDFGQNMTGWVRIRVSGKAGSQVRLSHAEILDEKGNFYTTNLRSAKQQICYILAGEGEEVYEPHFSFQGFRFVRVDEFPGKVSADNLEAVVAHSDMRPIGDLTTSHGMLNQLVKNIRWGMKGNFFDVPTDCPQRDERLGWTGDAQVFVRAASLLMDVAPFFRKWLRDVAAAQKADGGIPHVVPDVLSRGRKAWFDGGYGSTGWGDVAVVAPWTIYRYFGDADLLREQYPSMKAWVEFIREHAERGLLWNTGEHFGDWLGLDSPSGSYRGATPNDLCATAYYAYSTDLLSQAAQKLGYEEDAKEYIALRKAIGEEFAREYYTPNGRLAVSTQTAHVLALYFELVPENYLDRTIRDLTQLLKQSNNHLTTGFLGTPYLCHALSRNGRLDLAYELLLHEDYPSWLYPITKGATTIWEHWDSLKPDDTRWSDDMNSFNHYAYGAVADWMFSVIGGIDTGREPGYRHSIVAPKPGGGLTHATARMDTPYGELASDWKIEGGQFVLEVTVPHNTTATVLLPGQGGEGQEIGSGHHRFSCAFVS